MIRAPIRYSPAAGLGMWLVTRSWEGSPTPMLTMVPGQRSPFENATNVTRSEEHTSELQSLMRISYAVFCLKKQTYHNKQNRNRTPNRCIIRTIYDQESYTTS